MTFGCPLMAPVLAIDTIIANGALVPLVRYAQQRIVPVGPRARSRFVCNLTVLHVQIKPVRAFRYLSGGIDDFFNERKHSSYPSRGRRKGHPRCGDGLSRARELLGDGQEALEEFSKHHFDLVVLDLMLPRVPGERVCRVIRDNSDTPIIMLTAKGEVEDRIIGLELGADDYLIKPFSPRELVARVRALLRRVHSESEPQREVLEFGELTIDISGHKILVSGEEVDLTASEFKLLTTLCRYPGRVYSRMELVEKVLGYDFEGYERTIDSHVKNLRAKIGDNPRNPKWLHTVHGVGYRFEDPTKAN